MAKKGYYLVLQMDDKEAQIEKLFKLKNELASKAILVWFEFLSFHDMKVVSNKS